MASRMGSNYSSTLLSVLQEEAVSFRSHSPTSLQKRIGCGEKTRKVRTCKSIMQEVSILLGGLGSYSYLPLAKQNNGRRNSINTTAKRRDFYQSSRNQQKPQVKTHTNLKISKSIVARTAVAVFGLGLIDAGYSGDWSRIGVISEETEELLKIVALLVAPFCIFLLFYYPKDPEA